MRARTEWRGDWPQLILEPDVLMAILGRFGPEGWNRWVRGMLDGFMLTAWEAREYVPVFYCLRFASADLRARDLRGIDLSACDMEGSLFDGSDLRNASFGMAEGCSFRSCDLRGASFRGACVSGSDFSGAVTEGCEFRLAAYQAPPIGLSAGQLSRCRRLDPEPPVPDGHDMSVRVEGSLASVPAPSPPPG